MPFQFTLPTTSSFSFSTFFSSDTHPSLPLSASTYRGVLRDALKRHKRLPPHEQHSNLSTILLSLNNYLPYLLALDGGLGNQQVAGEELDVVLKSTPTLEWRPTLSDHAIPGREAPRLKIQSLEYEISFSLATLAYTNTLLSRAALQPLYSTATASPTSDQRAHAIKLAMEYLLCAASIHDHLSNRSDQISSDPPCVDITKATFRALTSLALSEATILAVLKDDPYPAAVAQNRNANDNEWMIRAPEIPKVRTHLFARLCLAASEHASNAHALLNSSSSGKRGKINADLVRYADDLRRTGRAKACRLLGLDAEHTGKTGEAIAWLQAGMYELGMPQKEESKKGLSIGRLKKEWKENREDKKVDKGTFWGSDAGKGEEGRVLEMLEKKWSKMNDTVSCWAPCNQYDVS